MELPHAHGIRESDASEIAGRGILCPAKLTAGRARPTSHSRQRGFVTAPEAIAQIEAMQGYRRPCAWKNALYFWSVP
jgi:hypothetical protein